MAEPLALVRFPDRGSAYAFVAELRRLRDLDALSTLRVHETRDEMLVEVPPQMPTRGLDELACRFGGRMPASDDERERLRTAVATAKATADETRERMREARQTAGAASAAVRAAHARAGGPRSYR